MKDIPDTAFVSMNILCLDVGRLFHYLRPGEV